MEEIRLEQLDKNFMVDEKIAEPDMKMHDIRQDPFQIYGLYQPKTEPVFRRLPEDVAASVSLGVQTLSLNTSGGRVRFATDSKYVVLKAVMPSVRLMNHMPPTGSFGFDMYIDSSDGRSSSYFKTFVPGDVKKLTDGYEAKLTFKTRKMRYLTINFPSYNSVNAVYIGLQEDAKLEKGAPYRPIAPMVYYGSSITQGGCSSRPGNIYQNMVCREFGIDYINLGFSGNGKGEDSIVNYMAGLEMSAFISDYDHNGNVRILTATHEKMYQTIRAAHPDIPYVILSRPDFDADYEESVARREVIFRTFHNAKAAGDKNIYLIDGEGIFRGPYRDCCTVDGVHPNDLGFMYMAMAVSHELRRAGMLSGEKLECDY